MVRIDDLQAGCMQPARRNNSARWAMRILASITGKDVTRLDALQAYTCVECGRCTEHCPAFNTGKVLNPKEIILGLRWYLNAMGRCFSEKRRASAST